MTAPTIADPLHDYRTASALVLAESRRDCLRAAALRHQQRIDRARAALASAEGNVAVCSNLRSRAHAEAGLAQLRAFDADRACAKARLAVQEAALALRAVEAEGVAVIETLPAL